MPEVKRAFYVGETVVLRLRISQSGTRAPADPATVRLDRIWLGTSTPVAQPDATAFTQITSGEYALNLDTTGMAPGTYGWRAVASDGPQATSIVQDSFILRALSGA